MTFLTAIGFIMIGSVATAAIGLAFSDNKEDDSEGDYWYGSSGHSGPKSKNYHLTKTDKSKGAK